MPLFKTFIVTALTDSSFARWLSLPNHFHTFLFGSRESDWDQSDSDKRSGRCTVLVLFPRERTSHGFDVVRCYERSNCCTSFVLSAAGSLALDTRVRRDSCCYLRDDVFTPGVKIEIGSTSRNLYKSPVRQIECFLLLYSIV